MSGDERKPLRAVGFDLDGTLFDQRRSAEAGLDAFLRMLGVAPSPRSRLTWFAAEELHFERWRAGEITFQEQRRERLRTVLPHLGLEPPADVAGLDELFDSYLTAYRRAWRPFPDSVRLLTTLRSAGLRVGVLTNGTEEQQLDKLRTVGLLNLLDVVCTSERIGAQKPDPKAFQAFAHELGVPPDACLFVGDNPGHDVAGASAAGMQPLLVDRYDEHADGIALAVEEALSGRAQDPARGS